MLEKLKLKVGLGLDMPQWVGNRRLKWPLTTQMDPWGTAQHQVNWALTRHPPQDARRSAVGRSCASANLYSFTKHHLRLIPPGQSGAFRNLHQRHGYDLALIDQPQQHIWR